MAGKVQRGYRGKAELGLVGGKIGAAGQSGGSHQAQHAEGRAASVKTTSWESSGDSRCSLHGTASGKLEKWRQGGGWFQQVVQIPEVMTMTAGNVAIATVSTGEP